MRNYENIQTLLLPTQKAINADVSCFMAWQRGEISTAKCLKLFREHNRQRDDISVSQDDFESWLYDIGYRRYDGSH